MWEDQPVALCSTVPLFGRTGWRRLSRTVVMPDFQGVGIGVALSDAVAEFYHSQGIHVSSTAAHPAMIAHKKRSPLWVVRTVYKQGTAVSGLAKELGYKGAFARSVVSFVYVGKEGVMPPKPRVKGNYKKRKKKKR